MSDNTKLPRVAPDNPQLHQIFADRRENDPEKAAANTRGVYKDDNGKLKRDRRRSVTSGQQADNWWLHVGYATVGTCTRED